MWIARNKNNKLYIYQDKPIKNKDSGIWEIKNSKDFSMCFLPECLFKYDVEWEDDKPTKIILKK